MHLVFKFTPDAGGSLKLKIEINTREHQSLHKLKTYRFEVNSDWHQAKADILSFEPEELFGTKLRALLQRRKNRDLFDLNQGLLQLGLDCDKVIACFQHYLDLEDHPMSRANHGNRQQSDGGDNRSSLRSGSCSDLSASNVCLAAAVLANEAPPSIH